MPDTFFDPHQRATIEAAMARIIPTDDTPGAREAGCIDFLERTLSGLDYLFAKPDGSGFEVLEGRTAEAWRTRLDIMRAKYVDGVRDLDPPAPRLAHAAGRSAGPVSAEPALQQPSPETALAFFPLLVTHTRQGFYADPIYGGNRGRVGWDVIGFPGPASMKEVHDGTYTTLRYFAEGEAEKVEEFHHGL